MFGVSILIFYHYVPHSNRCGAFCFLIKPSIFKASSCLRKNSPPTGGQVKRLPHFLYCATAPFSYNPNISSRYQFLANIIRCRIPCYFVVNKLSKLRVTIRRQMHTVRRYIRALARIDKLTHMFSSSLSVKRRYVTGFRCFFPRQFKSKRRTCKITGNSSRNSHNDLRDIALQSR